MRRPLSLASEFKLFRSKRHKLLFIIPKEQPIAQIQREIEGQNIPTMNTSLILSEQLRQIPPDRRPYEVGKILKSAILQTNSDAICLYHNE